MPALPEVPDGVPEWLRFALYAGFVIGALGATWYGWHSGTARARQPQGRDMVVRGGIIDEASAERIIGAFDRLTEAINGAVRFIDERDRKERDEEKLDEMEERLAARFEKRLRYPPS